MDYPRGIRPMRGKLQIRYTVDGQRYAETLDLAPTRTGVADAARIRKERISARQYGAPVTDRPFEQLAQAYLDALTVALSTRNSYRDALNIYWSGLAGRDIASITTTELIALDDAIAWPSEKTRANALIPLRKCFDHAVSRGWIRDNPARALRQGKRRSGSPDPYSTQERDALLAWLDGTLAGPYFRLAFGTGARTGELLALQWEDYDGESLFIHRARVRGKVKGTKTDTPRRVLLLPEARGILKRMARPIHGGSIFRNQYGRPYQSGYHLNQWFRRAHKATGVRYRTGPYPWRHTYASLALSSGVRPSLVAAQLGHRVDVLLTVYGKYVPRHDDMAELSKMGALWAHTKLEGLK